MNALKKKLNGTPPVLGENEIANMSCQYNGYEQKLCNFVKETMRRPSFNITCRFFSTWVLFIPEFCRHRALLSTHKFIEVTYLLGYLTTFIYFIKRKTQKSFYFYPIFGKSKEKSFERIEKMKISIFLEWFQHISQLTNQKIEALRVHNLNIICMSEGRREKKTRIKRNVCKCQLSIKCKKMKEKKTDKAFSIEMTQWQRVNWILHNLWKERYKNGIIVDTF